MSKTYLHYICK